jgi:NAD(P)-dependent dehydrogenase (short-subunit alcohol dehydrogenase family)
MDRIGLITGAGSGIGRATAIALSAEGYQLVLAGRRGAALEETAGACVSPTAAVPTDVTDPASVKNLFAETARLFGRLDLLFNNAGIGAPPTALEDIAFADWQRMLSVNLTGAFLCSQEAVRMMKAQTPRGGRIINNGSISAQTPRPGSAPYTASKHAITGLTKSIALDGRDFDIACGQIDIGNAETAMVAAMKQPVPQANGTLALEPVMDVAHVARAIVYMAGLPLDANVPFITVMATRMPLMGRG